MSQYRTVSVFVPLPHTENAYSIKPNKKHFPTALFRLEIKKWCVYVSGGGELLAEHTKSIMATWVTI